MTETTNKLLQEDIELVALSNLPFCEIQNKTVMVTGATGLIGSIIVKTLLCVNRLKKTNIKVIALARNEEKAKEVFAEIVDRQELEFLYADIREKLIYEGNVDYLIHTASITESKFFVQHPVETISISVNGTQNILEFAKQKSVSSMVYLSSMEAFGQTNCYEGRVREKQIGYIDVTNVRSSYSESKRMCELLCACYCSEYGVKVKTARLAQTFGAGVSKSENRVFAQFARSASQGEDIVLHTQGKSWGNYCYTRDAVKAIFLLLMRGENGETYTVANETTSTTIADMAHMVAQTIGCGKCSVVFDIPTNALEYGYAPDVVLKLDASKIRKLGWQPEVGLEEMYKRLLPSI